MNTANWIPDLFMKRVMEGADWTLFSPSTCPDLHDKFGAEFEAAYVGYEEKVARARSSCSRRSRRSSSGARCSGCCSRRATRGSRSRIRATCARRSSTSASSIRRTCARKSR
nr:hypothetical protein [Burkholderia mallei]